MRHTFQSGLNFVSKNLHSAINVAEAQIDIRSNRYVIKLQVKVCNHIFTCRQDEAILTTTTSERICSIAAIQVVRFFTTLQPIRTIASFKIISTTTTLQHVITAMGDDEIITPRTHQSVWSLLISNQNLFALRIHRPRLESSYQ